MNSESLPGRERPGSKEQNEIEAPVEGSVLLLPLASTTAAAAPQAPNLSGPQIEAPVCARPTTAARERQRRGGKEGVNPPGAYLPRSPREAGAPPAAAVVRRQKAAPPARGAAASKEAEAGRGRGSGQWSRSACGQWQTGRLAVRARVRVSGSPAPKKRRNLCI